MFPSRKPPTWLTPVICGGCDVPERRCWGKRCPPTSWVVFFFGTGCSSLPASNSPVLIFLSWLDRNTPVAQTQNHSDLWKHACLFVYCLHVSGRSAPRLPRCGPRALWMKDPVFPGVKENSCFMKQISIKDQTTYINGLLCSLVWGFGAGGVGSQCLGLFWSTWLLVALEIWQHCSVVVL